MTLGPLVMAGGLTLFVRLDADVDYVTDLLPALVLFGIGLSMTVAPLTAAVLAGADERNAGIASGVNNAISRVAGLVAVAAVGAVVAASFGASLDDELGANRDPAVVAAVDDAKRRPLARVDPPAPSRRFGSGWGSRPGSWPSAGCSASGSAIPGAR